METNFYLNDNGNGKEPDELIEKFAGIGRFDKKWLEQRKIFLWGPVDDDSAKSIVNRLFYMEASDPGKDITFYINSPGGIVTSGMVILDAMKMISSPVITVAMGLAASMGSILLSAGEKGRREVWPHSRVMIHQPSIGGGLQGQATDLEITAREILKTKQISADILSQNTGQSVERIMEDFDRDFWMNADEAVDYGIVDVITENLKF